MNTLTVTASGVAQRRRDANVTIGAVTGPELREARASHPAEIMGRIAGAWVAVAGSGEGHMTAIRQPLTTNPVYLFLEDGIPARSTGFFNHNALYELNVPQAGRIEVLKGPGTALHGSDAIGGVVNVETRAPSLRPTTEAFAEAGAHGWNRALLSLSGGVERDRARFDLNLTRSSGWRAATGYDRESATLRWDHALSDAAQLKTVASYSHIDQIDPSPLGRSQFEMDAQFNEFPIATRRVDAFRLLSSLELTTPRTTVTLAPFVRWNEMELVPSWMLSFDPVTYTSGHQSIGAVARVRRELGVMDAAFTGGVDVDYSPGGRTEYQITTERQGSIYTAYMKGALIYDYDVTFHGVSPYAQLEVKPLTRLNLSVGARYDRIGYDYDNALDAVTTGRYRRPADATVSYSHLSPKLGFAYELGSSHTLFGSFRHSFRAPSEGQLFRQGSAVNTIDLQPIRADAFEGGARGVIAGVDYEASAYDMRIHDDVLTFVTADNLRESQNAGETRHRGIELSLGRALSTWLRIDAALARMRHDYVDWQPRPTLSYGGNEIERAPRTLANVRARVAPALLRGGHASVEWVRVGSYWEDPENTSRYEGHQLVNARLHLPLLRGFEAVARMNNVFDVRYAETATYTAAELERLTPGAPRMIYLGVQARWPEVQR
jgi:outer membrane receptor protein involved in Fe transport